MQSEQNPDKELDPPSNSQSQQSVVRVDLTPEFQQSLRDLAKRYRSIRSDIQAVVQELQIGNFVGDRLTGIGEGYVVLKTRVKNRDIQKGKSAGYRLVYQVESPTSVLLLTIYSKSEREDISIKEIRNILNEFYGNA
ncbi:MAG: type II toxin-antitoxin system RelE/ParE family toxin [Timaviella obliquedivisa GSE-PSE-MK23-08B]|jgi:mRNA-degrading endonuclease RelE of RelBE toxin-antitoxin system|nr:type II toxin-antitoxin system RelE/ParE family toxin [Timaviella obliquedivisa GSE-PSE-MK23-08B]